MYDPSKENGVKPIDKSERDWKKINRRTIGVIRQWIDQSIYHHVSGDVTHRSDITNFKKIKYK